jgi:uncharacterized heparinase superfamily protein
MRLPGLVEGIFELIRRQFCASMWTPEQAEEIQAVAKEARPGIKTMALPQGLQVERGPDAVVEYIIEKLPGLIES